jgi:hypothetical protein
MSLKLSNDDSCAVDLLLEHSNPSGINTCFTQAPSESVQQRLSKVERLLHILDQFSVGDPPVDLAAKTLERCEGRAAQPGTSATGRPPIIALP